MTQTGAPVTESNQDKKFNKKKLSTKRRWLYNLLILVCVAVIGYSGYQLWLIYHEYDKADSSYEKVVNKVVSPPQNDDDEYPDIDFAALREINPDVIAWIYIPETKVNYPVVSGRDNIYYLTHILDGTRNANGTIFLDMNNSNDLSDDNSILHGHHMKNGSMFAQIEAYKNQEFFDEHPQGYLIMPDTVYRVEFFAGIVRDGSAETPINFGSLEEKSRWVKEVQGASTFKTDEPEVTTDTRFLSLSTCEYSLKDGRYLLSGVLVELER